MTTKAKKFQLKLPIETANLEIVREFVARIAENMGFSEENIHRIELAVDEASTNVIEYAYDGVKDGKIEIDCSTSDGELKIVMRDQGKSFDPSSVPEPNVKGDLAERKIGGLGIYLMRKLMDEVSYETSAEGDNLLTMTKRVGDRG